MSQHNDEPPFPTENGYGPRNAMEEWNPDTWDPDERWYQSGEVNIWDPVESEGFNEPGHWADRDPDMSAVHARRLAMRGEFDGAEHLPLIESNMRGVPTEGVQGTYTRVVRLSTDDGCPECGHEYGLVSVHTMAGVHRERCLVCEHVTSEG